jgi:hypothetical protein
MCAECGGTCGAGKEDIDTTSACGVGKMAVNTSDGDVVCFDDEEFADLPCEMREGLVHTGVLNDVGACEHIPNSGAQEARALTRALGGPPHLGAPLAQALMGRGKKPRSSRREAPKTAAQIEFEHVHDQHIAAGREEFARQVSEWKAAAERSASGTAAVPASSTKQDVGPWTGRRSTVADFLSYATSMVVTRFPSPEVRRLVLGVTLEAAAGERNFAAAERAAARAVDAIADGLKSARDFSALQEDVRRRAADAHRRGVTGQATPARIDPRTMRVISPDAEAEELAEQQRLIAEAHARDVDRERDLQERERVIAQYGTTSRAPIAGVMPQ